MVIIRHVKKLLGRESPIKSADLDRLSAASGDHRETELRSLLYELAFHNSASFVYDELKKPDSVFSELERDAFFQEMLILNFWMMEKVFARHVENIAGTMHRHYFGSLPDIEKRAQTLMSRFKTYSLCWDEYTGHHDEFGLKAGQILFGREAGYAEKSVSFWIISYTDDSLKKFKKVRKALAERKII